MFTWNENERPTPSGNTQSGLQIPYYAGECRVHRSTTASAHPAVRSTTMRQEFQTPYSKVMPKYDSSADVGHASPIGETGSALASTAGTYRWSAVSHRQDGHATGNMGAQSSFRPGTGGIEFTMASPNTFPRAPDKATTELEAYEARYPRPHARTRSHVSTYSVSPPPVDDRNNQINSWTNLTQNQPTPPPYALPYTYDSPAAVALRGAEAELAIQHNSGLPPHSYPSTLTQSPQVTTTSSTYLIPTVAVSAVASPGSHELRAPVFSTVPTPIAARSLRCHANTQSHIYTQAPAMSPPGSSFLTTRSATDNYFGNERRGPLHSSGMHVTSNTDGQGLSSPSLGNPSWRSGDIQPIKGPAVILPQQTAWEPSSASQTKKIQVRRLEGWMVGDLSPCMKLWWSLGEGIPRLSPFLDENRNLALICGTCDDVLQCPFKFIRLSAELSEASPVDVSLMVQHGLCRKLLSFSIPSAKNIVYSVLRLAVGSILRLSVVKQDEDSRILAGVDIDVPKMILSHLFLGESHFHLGADDNSKGGSVKLMVELGVISDIPGGEDSRSCRQSQLSENSTQTPNESAGGKLMVVDQCDAVYPDETSMKEDTVPVDLIAILVDGTPMAEIDRNANDSQVKIPLLSSNNSIYIQFILQSGAVCVGRAETYLDCSNAALCGRYSESLSISKERPESKVVAIEVSLKVEQEPQKLVIDHGDAIKGA